MNYDDILEWAIQRGFKFHPSVERRCHDGVWGLYALDDIPSGSEFAAFPKQSLLQPEPAAYPKHTSKSVQYIHAAAQAKHTGTDDQAFSKLGDSLEHLRDVSVLFFDAKEIQTLAEISSDLAQEIMQFQQQSLAIVNALCTFDPEIPRDIYVETTLNFSSRAVGSWGFVPFIDCFNHSAIHGLAFVPTDDAIAVVAKNDVKAGEELYVSYGDIDLFRHAVHYNYFDPDDRHFIEFGRRASFMASHKTNLHTQLFEDAGFRINVQRTPISNTFRVQHPQALLSIDGPSDTTLELAELLSKTIFVSESPKQFLLNKLSHLNENNQVHKISKKHLSGRLRRFYNMLKRDKHILESARAHASKKL